MKLRTIGMGLVVMVAACTGGGDDTGGDTTGGNPLPPPDGMGGIVQPPPISSGGPAAGQCQIAGRARISNAPGASSQPTILAISDGYLVAWSDERAGAGAGDLYAARIGYDGAIKGAESKIADTDKHATSPALAELPGGNAVVLYESCIPGNCAGGAAVGSVMVRADGSSPGAPTEMTAPAPVQRRPYVVSMSGGAYASFRDVEGGKVVSRIVKLDGMGRPIGNGVALGGGAEGLYPHVTAGNGRLGVAYRRTGASPEVVLALVGDGPTIEKELVVRTGSTTEANNPVVGWSGSYWTLAWEDERDGDARIYTATATADAGSAGAAAALYEGNGNWPTVASNGKQTVAAFYGFPKGAQVLLARLDNAGRRTGSIIQVSENGGSGKFPELVAGEKEGEFGLVWQDDTAQEVLFARVQCR